MKPEERSEARLKRLRLALSVAIMVFGLVMMAAARWYFTSRFAFTRRPKTD
jgi:hypothetical protein